MKTSTSQKSSDPNTSLDKKTVLWVTWLDAQTIGGPEWMPAEEAIALAKQDIPTMDTVGFCIYQDDDQIVIASTVGDQETSQIHKIPRAMVKRVRELDG